MFPIGLASWIASRETGNCQSQLKASSANRQLQEAGRVGALFVQGCARQAPHIGNTRAVQGCSLSCKGASGT